MRVFITGVIMCLFTTLACQHQSIIHEKAAPEYVKNELEKLAPVALECDLSNINNSERRVLAKLIQASYIIDDLFLRQVNPENPKLEQALVQSDAPNIDAYLDLFKVMFGPWNRLDHDKPFINNRKKPEGAGFYPQDITKDEFNQFLSSHPEQKDAFTSNFTLIRREEGSLKAIPYHIYYREQIDQLSQLLEDAARLTNDSSLQTYLNLRAKDLQTDDYFQSDMAWMDLSGNLEIVIGPYEVYEDKLFNYKAAYESFICIVDHDESKKLARFAGYLNELESNLPISERYKNYNRGSASPIKVVQEVFSAGDTKAGIQTTAFNLPNDERVREAKGSKKVMLKNIARAKYDKCWIPIVNTILADKPLQHVSFDAYFNIVLMHEMSHGLGPGNITLDDGTRTSVAQELKEVYSTIEECKADILAIYNLKYLIDNDLFPKDMEFSIYASYLGGMFRSIRFGIGEAHAAGVAIQFNYLYEKGAFYLNQDGKLSLDEQKLIPAVQDLSQKILLIQAKGNYVDAKSLIEKYGILSPVIKQMVDKLSHIPIDIRPSYPAANTLLENYQ